MSSRTPTKKEVAELSRDDWESLCGLLTETLMGVARVEDRMGKGNGLDGLRHVEAGISGWQYRRFDARFGDRQKTAIVKSIELARSRALSELGRPLVEYHVVANIDLEPGHAGSVGEIERWEKLRSAYRGIVDVEFHGLTWVHASLLRNLALKPEMFEDIAASIRELRARMGEEFDVVKQALALSENERRQLSEALGVLIAEANIHYDRGMTLSSDDEFAKAIVSLEDATRLLRTTHPDSVLYGRVMVASAGVRYVLGRLVDALRDAQLAASVLQSKDDVFYQYARGTQGVLLGTLQQYTESEAILLSVLRFFESHSNVVEIARTRTHLIEVATNARRLDAAASYAANAPVLISVLDSLLGPSETAVHLRGALANLMVILGERDDDYAMLESAAQQFTQIRKVAEATGLKRVLEAERMAADLGLWKIAADSSFNLALVRSELGDTAASTEALRRAGEVYERIGDTASLHDVRIRLASLSKR